MPTDTATTVRPCTQLCCCNYRGCTAARTRILDVGPGRELYPFCDDHIDAAVADMRVTPMPFSVR